MIRVSVWMIRAALLYLGTGFLLGALLLANKGMPFLAEIWQLLPIHVEFLLFGWTVQLGMGVAVWIMPRFSTPPRYGRLGLAWASFWLLNTGLWLAAFGFLGGESLVSLLLLGHALQFLSIMFFVVHIWRRIKPISLIAFD